MRPMALSIIAVAGTVAMSSWVALAQPIAASAYTSLEKGCKVLRSPADDPDAETDYYESICPGRDGMRVLLEGGDARSWIGLVPPGVDYKDGARFYRPLMEANFGSFPNVAGRLLEWRYYGSRLVALIVRIWGTDPRGNKSGGLVVLRVDPTKLHQTCAIGKTRSNKHAQAIADDLGKVCQSHHADAELTIGASAELFCALRGEDPLRFEYEELLKVAGQQHKSARNRHPRIPIRPTA